MKLKNGGYIIVKAPSEFPGKKYRKKYCLEHHLNYWKGYGIIPKNDEIIHHLDGNKTNNELSNLELLKRSDHSSNHGKHRKIKLVLLKCPFCEDLFIKKRNKTFLTKPGYRYTCCSKECANKFLRIKNTDDKERRINENLILEFKDFPDEYL